MEQFAQAVSMECTKDQYEKYLKEGLGKLGYTWDAWDTDDHDKYPILTTKYGLGGFGLGQINDSFTVFEYSYFINHFNPELFLSIAGMRTGEKVHMGEWMIAIEDSFDDAWGRVEKGTFREKVNSIDWSGGGEILSWRKATVDELINHFKKETMGADNTFGETNFNEKEHSFKFGDNVRAYDNEDQRGVGEEVYITKIEGEYPHLVIEADDLDTLKEGKAVKIKPYKYCEPYTPPLKITHAEIAEKFGTTHFIIK